MTITSSKLSRYKKEIGTLLRRIERLSTRCLFHDDLIKGTPGELYKKCGSPSCKCNRQKKDRHGPYKIIQIRVAKKQKLISLKKDDYFKWDLAKNHQYQMTKLKELEITYQELKNLIKEVIEERTIDFP